MSRIGKLRKCQDWEKPITPDNAVEAVQDVHTISNKRHRSPESTPRNPVVPQNTPAVGQGAGPSV
jgi:hypothetical protein